MRLALVTTTIRVPEVLRLYRARGSDVQVFVAADDKTPITALDFCAQLGAVCLQPHDDDNNWKCSKLIGRNTIGRRSIAILEALKWGADLVISIDDDNVCVNDNYYHDFVKLFDYRAAGMLPLPGCRPWTGIQVGVSEAWFDYGRWLVPPATQRGIPQSPMPYPAEVSFATGAKVGIAQGICLGDPDTSAVDRISRAPVVHQVSELLRAGVVVHPGARTVFNSQNTAFLRELAPCFLMVPQFGRFDDIFTSLICRRVMRETGHYLHLGRPFVWQQRNAHDLLTDLDNEMWGMRHVVEFADWLDGLDLGQAPHPLHYVRLIYGKIGELEWMPAGVSELGSSWCDDCGAVL